MSITLGGTVCVRNGIELDYCWEQAIESLLPVCEQVVVADGESSDGTWERLLEWREREPKLALCRYAWPDPKGDIDFWVNWINYAREHLRTDFHFQLDADEVLSEGSCYGLWMFKKGTSPNERVSLRCSRYNFWGGPFTLVPPGHCLGHEVVRVAPAWAWMPSDGAHPKGADVAAMSRMSGIEIFHYGFLRRREAYFEKSRQLHTMFFGGMTDQRMIDVERKPGNWMAEIENVGWKEGVPFKGQHPQRMHGWLKERGWSYV